MRVQTFFFSLLISFGLVFAGCGEATLDIEPEDDDVFVIEDEDTGQSNTGGETTNPQTDSGTTESPDVSAQPDMTMSSGCSGGEASCDDVCVDISTSNDHCGACNNPCPQGSSCAASECVCDQGELCGDSCVDTTSSNQHCGACDNPCAGGQLCIAGMCEESTEVNGILQASNQARSQQQDCGVYGMIGPSPALMGNAELHRAAQIHADDMAANNFFSHTGSDGSSFSQRVGRTDFQGFAMGENIAGGGTDPAGVVDRWIDSDGHCRNLMNPNATMLGVGYAVGGQYGTLWVQVFGR